jgi:hypothetical protein
MIDVIKPRNVEGERFAVAVPTDGPLAIIETYPNTEQLETGYRIWKEYAEERGITRPLPIELLNLEGKCQILTNMVNNF